MDKTMSPQSGTTIVVSQTNYPGKTLCFKTKQMLLIYLQKQPDSFNGMNINYPFRQQTTKQILSGIYFIL